MNNTVHECCWLWQLRGAGWHRLRQEGPSECPSVSHSDGGPPWDSHLFWATERLARASAEVHELPLTLHGSHNVFSLTVFSQWWEHAHCLFVSWEGELLWARPTPWPPQNPLPRLGRYAESMCWNHSQQSKQQQQQQQSTPQAQPFSSRDLSYTYTHASSQR